MMMMRASSSRWASFVMMIMIKIIKIMMMIMMMMMMIIMSAPRSRRATFVSNVDRFVMTRSSIVMSSLMGIGSVVLLERRK